MIPTWEQIEARDDVQAYLAAFDAYLQAGGSDASACAAGLREAAFAEVGK